MENVFTGSTTTIVAIHLDADPRFSYSLLLPKRMDEDTRLLVSVHGSERDPRGAFENVRDLAVWHNVAVLAPLFPRFADDRDDVLGYKLLRWGGIAYDEVLLQMVEEAHRHFGTPTGRFALSGYSGGGQFVERFSLFHARELLSLSIGAPGRLTLPTRDEPWWVGVGDAEDALGLTPDLDSLRALPIQIVAGSLDIGEGVVVPRDSVVWRENIELAGTTRLERSRTLFHALEERGADVRFDVVHDEAHTCPGAFEAIRLFVAEQLARVRGA